MGLDRFKSYLLETALFFSRVIPAWITYVVVREGSLDIYLKSSMLRNFLIFFSKHSLANLAVLSDLVVVDNVDTKPRFAIIYNFLTISGLRVFIHSSVEENCYAPTITDLFQNANWLEREAWDLYGVFFLNHPDLRRILTDYGFRGFPFRKDFPLTGYIELRFDDTRGDVVYEPVELSQELRFFNFATGWEVD